LWWIVQEAERLPSDSVTIDVRAAVRQQLLSDRMFGVEAVPVVLTPRTARRAAPGPSSGRAAADVAEQLRLLDEDQVKGCRKCSLCETRTQTVFGHGNPKARLVFVGEAPGFEEDRQGLAFVGRAGQLLTRMIENGMGLKRNEVFICNVLKCRPPNNRDPKPEEVASCLPYLERQIALLNPAIMLAVGRIAAQNLLATDTPIGRLRGRVHAFGARRIPLVVTYHPAYLLRSPTEKRKAWEDLKFARRVAAGGAA
jgi:DNA polymerase